MSNWARWAYLVDALAEARVVDVPGFVTVAQGWVDRNRKALGRDVLQRWGLASFWDVDLSSYGDLGRERVAVEVAAIRRIAPGSADAAAMLLADALRHVLATPTGKACPVCALQGEMYYSVLAGRDDVVTSCSACSYAEDLLGGQIQPVQSERPAAPAEVASGARSPRPPKIVRT